ncbi:MAG: methyltransferase domain-containing protein [Pirellulales bacterium]
MLEQGFPDSIGAKANDWEERYRAADTPWDKGRPHPALLQWLVTHPRHMTGSVLVPGSGLGHDVRAIAEAEPAARVLGLDIAPSAVAAATRRPHPPNATFREGDLFDLPPDLRGRCAWVWKPNRVSDGDHAGRHAVVPLTR